MKNIKLKDFLTKDDFVAIINDIEKQHLADDKFSQATSECDSMGCGFRYNYDLIERPLLKLLAAISENALFKDVNECNDVTWIEWWLFDEPIKENNTPRHVWDIDGTHYILKNAGDLWDFLHGDMSGLERVVDEKDQEAASKTKNSLINKIKKIIKF